MANTPSRQDIEARVDQLGMEKGKGQDTSVKFTLQMIEGGYHNLFDLTKNKHGLDRDDAMVMAERYAKAQNAASIFDHKGPNERKASSCARAGIKLGGWPKGGQGEPIATVNQFVSDWTKLRAKPGMSGKLQDCNNALLQFARAQLKRDTLIDPSEFDQFFYKSAPDDATAEEIIASAVKKLDGLIAGNAKTGVQCNSPSIVTARHNLRQELAAIAKAKNPQIAPTPPVTP